MKEAMNLTPEQRNAITKAVDAIGEGSLFRIGGYAGTGKTTIAKYIVASIPGAMVCAFTGKAANRLAEKGLPMARTIHSTIYDYDPHRRKFHLKDKSDISGRYFLIDEGSMVSRQLWEDVNSFQKPIIVLGDPGQLEPIGDDPNLMRDPDVVLYEIHRQGEGSGIITFANDIRCGLSISRIDYPDVEIFYDQRPALTDAMQADVVICGFNRRRKSINDAFRSAKGYKDTLQAGEKVICLKNNMELGVFNGQMFDVREVKWETDQLISTIVADNGDCRDMMFHKLFFGKARTVIDKHSNARNISDAVVADYGYAITAHKSQGSEWDNVLVIDQQCPYWDAVRWRYTAITRGSKTLKYFFE